MTINKHNYEAYFLDYLEGNLTVELQAELMVFLEANPDLKDELEMMREDAPVLVQEEGLSFEFKGRLKKSKLFTDDELIAVIEKDASQELAAKVNRAAAQDKNIAKEMALFEKTKLPNEMIVFADKESLKRRVTIIPLFYRAMAVAASLLIVFFVGKNYFFDTEKATPFAQITTDVKQNKEENSVTNSTIIIPANAASEEVLAAGHADKRKKGAIRKSNRQEITEPLLTNNPAKEENKPEPVQIEEQPALAQTKIEEATKEKIIAPPANTIIEPVLATTPTNKYESPADFILQQTTGIKAQNSFREKWLNRLQYAAAIYQKTTGNKAQVKKGENDCGIRYDIAFGKVEFSKTIACK